MKIKPKASQNTVHYDDLLDGSVFRFPGNDNLFMKLAAGGDKEAVALYNGKKTCVTAGTVVHRVDGIFVEE